MGQPINWNAPCKNPWVIVSKETGEIVKDNIESKERAKAMAKARVDRDGGVYKVLKEIGTMIHKAKLRP